MRKGLGVMIGAGLLLCAGGAVSAWVIWKPVMPDVVVTFKPGRGKAPDLMLVYNESGGDPLVTHPGIRLGSCETRNLRCEMPHARYEYRTEPSRNQSIQVRRNPNDPDAVIGGVAWKGPSYPRRVELTCDLAIADKRRACSIVRVIT